MEAVAGADEAGQTPRTPEQAGRTTDLTQPTTDQGPPASDPTKQTTDQALPANDPTKQTTDQGQQANGQPQQATEPVPEQTSRTAEQTQPSPGFGERGRMRRRARFLRKARELAYRDLGGLVFDLHRFGQRNDQLVLAKLATLGQIDTELRGLEQVLRDRRPVTGLREVGIAACPRCAAIHGSDDRFCPGCGLAFDAHADRPISTAPVGVQSHAPAAVAQPPAATPRAPAPVPGTVSAPAVKPTAAAVAAKPAASHHSRSVSPPPASPAATHSPSAPVPSPASPPSPSPASPPSTPASTPPAPEGREPVQREPEDEPTQILRPPAPGA